MKKSELRQIIKEEIQVLNESSNDKMLSDFKKLAKRWGFKETKSKIKQKNVTRIFYAKGDFQNDMVLVYKETGRDYLYVSWMSGSTTGMDSIDD
jgi:phosphopantetheinyl transferase (holo-ACP synthase)